MSTRPRTPTDGSAGPDLLTIDELAADAPG